jgi:hypothetical protein
MLTAIADKCIGEEEKMRQREIYIANDKSALVMMRKLDSEKN